MVAKVVTFSGAPRVLIVIYLTLLWGRGHIRSHILTGTVFQFENPFFEIKAILDCVVASQKANSMVITCLQNA